MTGEVITGLAAVATRSLSNEARHAPPSPLHSAIVPNFDIRCRVSDSIQWQSARLAVCSSMHGELGNKLVSKPTQVNISQMLTRSLRSSMPNVHRTSHIYHHIRQN